MEEIAEVGDGIFCGGGEGVERCCGEEVWGGEGMDGGEQCLRGLCVGLHGRGGGTVAFGRVPLSHGPPKDSNGLASDWVSGHAIRHSVRKYTSIHLHARSTGRVRYPLRLFERPSNTRFGRPISISIQSLRADDPCSRLFLERPCGAHETRPTSGPRRTVRVMSSCCHRGLVCASETGC